MIRRQAGLPLTCTCCVGDFTAGTATLGRKGFLLTSPGVSVWPVGPALTLSKLDITRGLGPGRANHLIQCVCIYIYIYI